MTATDLEFSPNSSAGAIRNKESSSSSRFERTTIDGLVVRCSLLFAYSNVNNCFFHPVDALLFKR